MALAPTEAEKILNPHVQGHRKRADVTSANRFVICLVVLLAWLSNALVAQTQTASALSRSWKELRTPAFTVAGDAPDGVLSDARAEIDAFRAAIRQLFPGLSLDSPRRS